MLQKQKWRYILWYFYILSLQAGSVSHVYVYIIYISHVHIY